MTFDGIRRLSPYWSLALCYGVVTAVGLIPGLLYGNEFAYWLLGFWLILPVSALLCTFRAAYRQNQPEAEQPVGKFIAIQQTGDQPDRRHDAVAKGEAPIRG